MKVFKKIKDWIVRHWPTRRRIIQFYTFLLYNANSKGYINGTIFKGNSKYMCVPGMNCYSCPGAVAACPLGAFQNALNASNTTTAYYVFGILGLFGLILGRTICGFFCPIGLGQELLHKIKTPKIRKSRYTRLLSYLKYVILAVLTIGLPIMYSLQSTAVPGFCKYICPTGTFEGGIGLLLNPANQSGSRSMLDQLGPIFTWKFVVLSAIIVMSVFLYRPFCRFLCPLGALYGFFNRISLLGVKLDKNKCTDCGLCIEHCKMDVTKVGDHECISCGECISVCPAQAITWKGSQIFLRKNDIATPAPADGPKVDIRNLGLGAPITVKIEDAPQSNDGVMMAASHDSDPQPTVADSTEQPVLQAESVVPEAETASTVEAAQPKKAKRSKKFWAELTAWILAGVVLISSLIYFNLLPEPEITDIQIGAPAPQFSLQKYGYNDRNRFTLLDEKFNSADYEGKVMVVNFWATWCGPCVAELPEFAEVAHEFKDDIVMVAIHGRIETDPALYILQERNEWLGWTEYGNFFFLQDVMTDMTAETFIAYGGVDSYPITVIVGKDGNITFTRQGALDKATLTSEVEKAINA